MDRYYLLANYLVPVFHRGGAIHAGHGTAAQRRKYFKSARIPLPANYPLVSLGPDTRIGVAFVDVDRGYFLITSPSQQRAYEVARAIQAYFFLFHGWYPDPDPDHWFLFGTKRIPQPSWEYDELLDALSEVDPTVSDLTDLRSGVGIDEDAMNGLRRYIGAIFFDGDLNDALAHFSLSRQTVYGFMPGTYYDSHYRPNRLNAPDWFVEKLYLENRPRYELAFVAVFKAIERLLRTSGLHSRELPTLFASLRYPSITFDTIYTRRHEIFLSLEERIPYGELVRHFLDIRNAVAAHANRNPPDKFLIYQDNIFEIQLFVSELFLRAVRDNLNSGTAKAVRIPRIARASPKPLRT